MIQLDQSYKTTLKPVLRLLFILLIILIVSIFIPEAHIAKGLYAYVPLHTFLETISILASMMIFSVCWTVNIKERERNFLILASVFFGVGLIDFLHVLSFEGMPDFVTSSGREKGIMFWLAARILSSAGLLIIAVLPWKPLLNRRTRWIILGIVLVVVFIVAWIGLWHFDLMPRTFIEGIGLTRFKIYTEYFITLIYSLSAFLFFKQMNNRRRYDVVGLFSASCIMAMSELFFTLYTDIADLYNLLGHIYKVIAYGHLYKSIFIDTIQIPLFQLNESNKKLEMEIFDRQKIENRLSENEELLSTILHTLPVGVFVKDISKNFVYKMWNKFAENLLGIDAKELIGKNDYEIFPIENADFIRRKDLEASQTPGVVEIPEQVLQSKNGAIILHTRKTTIRDKLGKPLFLIGVSEDVTDIKKVTDDLRNALNARDEFLIIASHELKTPITSLKLRLQIMQKNSSLDHKIANEIDVVLGQVDRLTRLINTILDVSRIQTGKFNLELEAFNLAYTINKLMEQFDEQLKNSNCKLSIIIPQDINVFWDKSRIEQVLSGLISNSIKYAPSSVITIHAIQDESKTTMTITDSGPGISKDRQGLLFTRFERAGASISVSGLGLGLYISKQIIEALGGTIRIESDEGKGISVIVVIPNKPFNIQF